MPHGDQTENLKKKRRKLKYEEYEHCLEGTQLENKIRLLEKNKVDLDRLRENHKELKKKTIN